MSDGRGDVLARWVAENASSLASLEPDAPLDDLEPLREIVGAARVVAIGENAHYIREFALVRHRVMRFLVEYCGFTVFAFESGFSEGFELAACIESGEDPEELDRLAEESIPCGLARPAEVRAILHRLLEYNRSADTPVRFAGIDVPAAGGSLLPALDPLGGYLAKADPDAVPLLESILPIAERVTGTSMAQAAPLYGGLTAAEQDTLTATLSRLLARFRSMGPQYAASSDRRHYDIALWMLEGACHTDHHLRGMADLMAGAGAPGGMGVREVYMAGSVRRHLHYAGSDARVLLAAHNAHIQKTPVHYDARLSCLPMGLHLDRMLGDDYVALGVTSVAGRTAELQPDGTGPFGFTMRDVPLQPPEPGSIEAVLARAGTGLGIVDLRRAAEALGEQGSDEAPPDRIRIDTGHLRTPVLDAFDGVINVPRSTVADDLGF